MRILPYSSIMKDQWEALVERAPQATFLHRRDYMDYHADRFVDNSLMAIDDKDRVIALLPANIDKDGVVTSHAGLTYGGWLTDNRHVNGNVMLEIWEKAIEHLRTQGAKKLVYKAVPHIYHRYPAEEDVYGLFRYGAELTACNLSTTIEIADAMRFNENARRGVATATRNGVRIVDNCEIEPYFELLTQLLNERYGVNPVHTVEEMRLLMSRFPDNITMHGAYIDERLVAGVILYRTETVDHAQYIGASPEGRESKALPLLFEHLIAQSHRRYFDFGISTEDGGHYLNAGLLRQKAGMGGRGIAYNIYTLEL